MDATPFFVMLGAVAAANLLSFGLVWSLFQISKAEKDGGNAKPMHLIVILFCLFFILGGIYLGSAI